MEYKYLYQTKENENREGVVKAASRADAYAVLRKKGIRPYRLIGDDPPKWRRPAAIASAAAFVAAAAAGIAIYRWDQQRTIWMGADELEYKAYRAADGRIYFECNGREHSISIVESPNDPSEAGGESYVLRMGYNKAARDIKMTRPEMWGVLNGNYKRLELDGFGKEDNTVICRMADELPPATEEMERRIAEYDSMMEKSVG